MKNKIVIGIVSVVVLAIISFAGVGYYFINYVAKPEKIKKLVITNLQEQFPNAEIKLQGIKYSLFPGIKLKIENLDMKLKKGKTSLLSVSKATVDIPVLNILKGGGRFQVKIDSPEIHLEKSKVKTNWEIAIGSKKVVQEKVTTEAKENNEKQEPSAAKKELSLPAFVLHSFLDVKITNAKFSYSLKPESEGTFIIEKLLLKRVGLSGPSAFEMVSRMKMKAGENTVSVRPILIGTFNLNEIAFQNKINVPVELSLHDFSIDPFGWTIPVITNRINVSVTPQGDISGHYSLTMKSKNKINLDFKVNKGDLFVDKFAMQIMPEDLLQILNLKIDNLDTRKLLVKMGGKIKVSSKGKIKTNLKMHFENSAIYKYLGEQISIKANLNISEQRILSTFNIKAFMGDITSKSTLLLPADLSKIDINKIKPISSGLVMKDVVISQAFIDQILKKTTVKEEAIAQNVSDKGEKLKNNKEKISLPPVPPLNLKIKIENLKVGNTVINKKCDASFKHSRYSLSDCLIQIDQGSIKLVSNGNITPQMNITNHSEIDMKNFSLLSLSPFLPAEFGKIKGTGDMKVTMDSNVSPDMLTYKGKYSASFRDGEIEKIKLDELAEKYLSKLSFLKSKVKNKKLNLSNSFESIKSSGIVSNVKIDINNFLFNGVKKKITLNGKGVIYPFETKGHSEIIGTWQDSAGVISSHLYKETGKKILPFRLHGEGLSLLPDYEYSVKKVGTAYLKNKGKKKVQSFLKKKLGTKADKILKNKKVNKLLKGLFD